MPCVPGRTRYHASMKHCIAFLAMMIAMGCAPCEAQPMPLYQGAGAIKCSKIGKGINLELAVTWSQGYLVALESSRFEFEDIKTYIMRYCYLHPSHMAGEATLIFFAEHARKETIHCMPRFLYPPHMQPQPLIPPR